MNEIFPSPAAGLFGRRLKRVRGAKVPVTVITGFLGAGKTTLLSRWIRSPELAGAMVIVNELGEVGLDHRLLTTSTDIPLLLDSGCGFRRSKFLCR